MTAGVQIVYAPVAASSTRPPPEGAWIAPGTYDLSVECLAADVEQLDGSAAESFEFTDPAGSSTRWLQLTWRAVAVPDASGSSEQTLLQRAAELALQPPVRERRVRAFLTTPAQGRPSSDAAVALLEFGATG